MSELSDECPAIDVEVIYAEPARQWRWRLRLPPGSAVADAIAACPISELRPQWNVAQGGVGMYGKAVAQDLELKQGDRVELYRPLLCDPKEIRRQRAERNR